LGLSSCSKEAVVPMDEWSFDKEHRDLVLDDESDGGNALDTSYNDEGDSEDDGGGITDDEDDEDEDDGGAARNAAD
ncbi:MAG: hypothetical protein HKN32_10175, partial [Flavobacteriales bacterium]|nr:hypothetical protein [Flavobacteriales bacterium]